MPYLSKVTAVSLLVICSAVSFGLAAQVSNKVIDGMVLRLAPNALQQVEVRAQSFGPGFCQVEFSFADKRKGMLAPPLPKWSDWTKLDPAIQGGSHALGFSEKCDTGAIAEVRYDQAAK